MHLKRLLGIGSSSSGIFFTIPPLQHPPPSERSQKRVVCAHCAHRVFLLLLRVACHKSKSCLRLVKWGRVTFGDHSDVRHFATVNSELDSDHERILLSFCFAISTSLTGTKSFSVDRGCTPAPQDAMKLAVFFPFFSCLSFDISVKKKLEELISGLQALFL